MTERRKRYLRRKEEKERKTEELIKSGVIKKVIYEEREQKKALPNRKSNLSTVAGELEDRQKTAENATAIYYKMLSVLLPKLAQIKDPRNPLKIKHKITTLLIYGCLISMLHIGSRRNANRELSTPIVFENLKTMFPDLETIPHADTLARLLERVEVSEIQDSMIELLKTLIKKKKFNNYLYKKSFIIAVDGTQKFFRGYKWSDECLKRHVGGEKRIPQYYCYVLEAVMILGNGIVLPVTSEFVDDIKYNSPEEKQDCEIKGFYRLAYKLKKIFRNMKIILVADGLYACGPVITKCREYKWQYMICLKKDRIPNVWKEALALMKINPENSLKCYWGDREQIYKWANAIEYEYLIGKIKKREILNVVICNETWEENHSRSTKKIEFKETQYAWLSSKEITEKNVFTMCTKIARGRWKIENNILKEKHQGYEYEHCYSYNWNAMKGFQYLMKIGHFLNALATNSEILIEKVNELGIRGFINSIKKICEGSPLDKYRIENARNRRFNWKLDLAA